jgi:flagellar biosynthesis/type III secretory pathway chaperone
MQLPAFEVDFTFLDETFQNQPDRLKKLLELMHKEFNLSRDTIINSLTTQDVTVFREAKHKLMPSLNYLKVDGLRDILEDIKAQLLTDPASFQIDKYDASLRHYFNTILDALQQKLLTME